MRMQKSKQHAKPSFDEGVWSCTECGAETGDFELFEESGEFEDCIARAVDEGVVPDPNDVVAWAEVERVRKHIEGVRGSMKAMGEAAEKAGTSLKSFNSTITYTMKDVDLTTEMYRTLTGYESTLRKTKIKDKD